MSGDEIERRLGGKPIARLLLLTQHRPPYRPCQTPQVNSAFVVLEQHIYSLQV
jgi:hypothetical protein